MGEREVPHLYAAAYMGVWGLAPTLAATAACKVKGAVLCPSLRGHNTTPETLLGGGAKRRGASAPLSVTAAWVIVTAARVIFVPGCRGGGYGWV